MKKSMGVEYRMNVVLSLLFCAIPL